MPMHLGRLLFGTLLLAALAGCDFDILIDELDRVVVVVEDDCWDCYDAVYVEETVYEPVYVEDTYYYDDWDVDYGYDEYYVDVWAADTYYEEESYVAEETYEPDYATDEYFYGDDGDYTFDDWDAVYY